LLEITDTIPESKMRAQFLDKMDLEREKGITIKLQPIRIKYEFQAQKYYLNLIDTPGHVDFSYEVSRALAACEGAILLVDAQKGVQAQTLANLSAAQKANLTIIPAINKIDLAGAEPDKVADEVASILNIKASDILRISAKTGQGIEKLLEKIIQEVSNPDHITQDHKALIFDAVFDEYRGVISYVRVFSGEFSVGDNIKFLATKHEAIIGEVGFFGMELQKSKKLSSGEIGYIICGLKDISDSKIGDTIAKNTDNDIYPEALTGYSEPQAKVFASFYCTLGEDFAKLKKALEKLKLNDSALSYEPENSASFGYGFRCGFLGLLHMEISKERLEREFDLNLVVTTPTTVYKIIDTGGRELLLKNPSKLPNNPAKILEPWIKMEIISPSDYVGAIMKLVHTYRSKYTNTEYLEGRKAILYYEFPLSEIMTDFYDRLKSISSGFASMNYEVLDWRAEDLVKLEVDIAEKPIDAFTQIVHRNQAQVIGRKLTEKLQKLIPRQLFEVKIQARIGSKIIASEKIPPMRKDVIAKLYGGDRTRKDKLLKKQAAGKKKMKQLGSVEIPKDLFLKFYK
ncbi:translation elongation factor 4, partial [Patescibacteria group bacterium]